MSEAPPFWWEPADWRAVALAPFAFFYGAVAARRMRRARREPMAVPVLCVGNFTVGGSGKTPAVAALVRQARRMKLQPGVLSRGYGGSSPKPRLVDAERDRARDVGDEPLLIARHAPVAVGADRAAGAGLLIGEGCDFLIMDDGFQSARIAIDHALLVVDARRGLGNGRVIPAGPLRAPLVEQLRFTDAVLKMGAGEGADDVVRKAARAGRPVFEAALRPKGGAAFSGRRFLAFAGIGHPRKFFDSLAEIGAEVVTTRSFPDHHFYEDDELQDLEAAAARQGLALVTTAKDAVRLRHGSQIARRLAETLTVLEVEAVFADRQMAERIIAETLSAYDRRKRG